MKLRDNRILSMRIVKSSQIPETLHHSVHSCAKAWDCKDGTDFVSKYRKHKEANQDQVMLDLLGQYENKVVQFIDKVFGD